MASCLSIYVLLAFKLKPAPLLACMSVQSRKDAFVKSLVGFVQQAKFKRVLLLAGMDAGLFQDYDKCVHLNLDNHSI